MRKLSLNKFRMSPEQQEPRHTPEDGNGGRSQSQSSQEPPVRTYTRATKRENDNGPERGKGISEELKKPEKLLEKPASTVSVVQRKSTSLKSFAGAVQQGELYGWMLWVADTRSALKPKGRRFRDIRLLAIISLSIVFLRNKLWRDVSADFAK